MMAIRPGVDMISTTRNLAFLCLACTLLMTVSTHAASGSQDCVIEVLGDIYTGSPESTVLDGAYENCEELNCQDMCEFAPDFDPFNCEDMYCASGPSSHPEDCGIVSTFFSGNTLVGAQAAGDCACDYCEV